MIGDIEAGLRSAIEAIRLQHPEVKGLHCSEARVIDDKPCFEISECGTDGAPIGPVLERVWVA